VYTVRTVPAGSSGEKMNMLQTGCGLQSGQTREGLAEGQKEEEAVISS
jgi:hypothetical protein